MQPIKGTYKGTYRNGVVHPEEPISAADGQKVVITLIETDDSDEDTSWDELMQFLAENAIDTGVPDLADQHDHYLHGTPKREI